MTGFQLRTKAFACAVLGGAAALGMTKNAAYGYSVGAEIEVLAVTGDAPPEGNGALSTVGAGPLNVNDVAMFVSTLSGTSGGGADNEAIYLYVPGTGLVKVVREGDASPDGDGVFFHNSAFVIGALNDSDSHALVMGLTGTDGGGSDDSGVYRDTGSGLTTLVREGDAAPGGEVFQFFYNCVIGAGDHVSFFAGLNISSSIFGFFRVDPDGTVRLIARDGTSAPGGGAFNPGNTLPYTNASGQVAFDSQITGSGSTFGAFRYDGGTTITKIARTNDVLGSDTLFVPAARGLTNDGRVIVNSALNGSTSERVLAIGDGSTLTKIYRTGDVLPGGGTANVQQLDTAYFNDANEAAIVITDNTNARRILFRDDLGNDTVIARGGTLVPNGDGMYNIITLLSINDAGGIVFYATLTGTSGGFANDKAIYYWNGSAPIELFREGDVVDINGSQTISDFLVTLGSQNDDAVAVQLTLSSGDQALVKATPRVNEDFDSAYQILSGVTTTGDLAIAMSDVSASCDPASPDLFYSIDVATGPATLEVDTCGSIADTTVAVFNSAQVELACSADCTSGPCSGPDACVSVGGLLPGTYYIRVGLEASKLAGVSGEFQLTATVAGGTGACCLPDQTCADLSTEDCMTAGGLYRGDQTQCANVECFNDNCADAIPVSMGTYAFSTVGATTDGPANNTCETGDDSNGQTFADIWYVYTADCTGTLTVTTCEELGGSANFDTDIKIYDGMSCGSLSSTLLGCNDDDDDNTCGTVNFHSTVRVPVHGGQQYLIRVGGWGSLADMGTGELLIACDPMLRACCLSDGTCATITPEECDAAGGLFQIDAADCASGACPSATCAPDVCQMFNTTAGNTSDASTLFSVADDYTPAGDVVVDSVCWWGVYLDFTPTQNPCGPGAGDSFSITYYTGAVPTTVAYGPFTGNMVEKTTDGAIGSFTVYRYQALHPPIELAAGTTYWVQIRNDLPGDCTWLWTQSTVGNDVAYQDADGNGYTSGEAFVGDMAFCLGFGEFTGACCMTDGSCAMLSSGDCDAAGGTFQGVLSHCLTSSCPQPTECLADLVDTNTFNPPPDGVVDGADLAFLLGEWGANPGSLADIVDTNTFQPPPDGIVDGADLAFLLGAWGDCD